MADRLRHIAWKASVGQALGMNRGAVALIAGIASLSCGEATTEQEIEAAGDPRYVNSISDGVWVSGQFDQYRDHDYFKVSVPKGAKVVAIEIDASGTPKLIGLQRIQITSYFGEGGSTLVDVNGFSEEKLLQGEAPLAGASPFAFSVECGGLHPYPSPYKLRVQFR